MKYNSNNKPLVCMQTTSKCYTNTKTMSIKGVLWHSTGANNPALSRYVQPSDNAKDKESMLKLLGTNKYGTDWNHGSVSAGLNCWIGKLADGTVTTVQTMPWNYRPWGCGSGKNGSCNDGWIQFEICEDALNDKSYFEKTYKEACEITAYLCKTYGLNPEGYTTHNGVKVPVILCHQDSYKLGLGTNHSDIYHWFNKYGKDMDDVRKDVKALLSGTTTTTTSSSASTTSTTDKLYRIRKSWDDAKSQLGAYKSLDNAIKDWKSGYYVYDWNGKQVYPEVKVQCSTVSPDVELPMIQKGSTGVAVKVLQTILGTTVTGTFNDADVTSFKAFQKNTNQTADGICGKNGWKAICDHLCANTYKS